MMYESAAALLTTPSAGTRTPQAGLARRRRSQSHFATGSPFFFDRSKRCKRSLQSVRLSFAPNTGGVFFGWASDTSGEVVHLRAAKMAIRWGTTRGVMELAHSGPNDKSLVSLPADIAVRKVSAVFEVTPEATEKWEAA